MTGRARNSAAPWDERLRDVSVLVRHDRAYLAGRYVTRSTRPLVLNLGGNGREGEEV